MTPDARRRRAVRGTPARTASGSLSEAAFDGQVDGLARFYGWLSYHTRDSRGSAAGFPDRVFVRGPELLFVELKADDATGRATRLELATRSEWLRDPAVSNAQATWLEALRTVEAAVDDAVSRLVGVRADEAEHPPPAVEAHVWRPRDWPLIERRLARGRILQPTPAPT